MWLVLHNACEIYAGKQINETSGAFEVEVLEVTPDIVCCFQDGLSLLVVQQEQVVLNHPTVQGFAVPALLRC